MTSQLQSDRVSLEKIHTSLAVLQSQLEQKMNGAVEKLQAEGGEIDQAKLLALQTQISGWSNLSNLISGILRAVADAIKATTQNIR
ncbi:MAG: hypothetical protein LBD34_02895 [Puniceicoccales bacterium]|jgi:hypothetical protein|nr:hypothetical protein [Puniceicoccales bacterium]